MASLVTKGTTQFAVNDILRIKDGLSDEWMKVTAVTDASHYIVERDKANVYGADANPAWKKGAAIVNYKQTGSGGVYQTACETNGPYLSIFDHDGSPWATINTRLRIGNLNGFLGYSSDLYGIAIGETNKYLKYDPTNGLQVKGTITITGGSGIASLTDAGDLAVKDAVGTINILHNGGFRNSLTHWTTSSISGSNSFGVWHDDVAWTLRDGDSPTGFGSSAYIFTDTASPGPQEGRLYSAQQRVTPGKNYILRFLGANHRFSNTSCRAYIILYDSAGAWVRSIITDYVTTANPGGPEYTDWQEVTRTFTTASNEQKVRIWFYATDGYASGSSALFLFDQVILCEGDAVPEWTALSTNILNWEHGSDVTKIDGGNIYTNTITASSIAASTITASEIKGTAFGTLTITSGKIAINTTDALEIQASGNVKVLAGGDIEFVTSDSDPGQMQWGSEVFFGSRSNGRLCAWPDSAGSRQFSIGYDAINNVEHAFHTIDMTAYYHIYKRARYSSNFYALINLDASSTEGRMDLSVRAHATDLARTIRFQGGAAGSVWFAPLTDKVIDFGRASYAWDDAYADDWHNVADFYHLDTRDDLAAIRAIKGSGIISDVTGLELIDDDTIPVWMLSKYKKDGEEIDDEGVVIDAWNKGDVMHDADGKPYLSMKLIASLLMGATRQLDTRLEKIEKGVIP